MNNKVSEVFYSTREDFVDKRWQDMREMGKVYKDEDLLLIWFS
jgi:hypothetical protein